MIEYHGYNLILKYAPKGCRMLELGNQEMNLADVQNISAKEHFSGLGYNHTSIDKNGKDGALPLNLSEPIIEDLGQFDIVTDAGTTEHVEDLYNSLRNTFGFCAINGVMLHKNPKTGNFPGHGNHFFTLDFWKAYAKACKLDILEILEHPIYHNRDTGWECIAILKKTDNSKFLSKEEFNKISNLVHKI